jgi:hypothetical protein
LWVVIGEVYPSRSGFRYALQGRQRFSIAHPSIPSRGEGKKYRLSNDLFPLPTGGGEGVGDPIQPSLCSSTDILYAMVYMRIVGATRRGQRGAHLSPILRSSQYTGIIRHGSAVSHRKRLGNGKEGGGAQRPYRPGRCSTRSPERTETTRLRPPSDGSHAAGTALAFALGT